MRIQSYEVEHLDAIIRLSLRAWEPVFNSVQQAMDNDIYRAFYPEHWRISQQKAVEDVCTAVNIKVWIARVFEHPKVNKEGYIAGFIAVNLHPEDKIGEIQMVAVDPDFQGRGIGSALTKFAMNWMKKAGMSLVMVETGGDLGHAPARHTYEKAGFELLPIARYFKKL